MNSVCSGDDPDYDDYVPDCSACDHLEYVRDDCDHLEILNDQSKAEEITPLHPLHTFCIICTSVVCTSSDIGNFNTAKNAAKVKAEALATTLTKLISEKTDESNVLRLRILALNQQISAAGGTTAQPACTVDMEGEI